MKPQLRLKKWHYLAAVTIAVLGWIVFTAPTAQSGSQVVEAAAPKTHAEYAANSTDEHIDSLQLERLKRSRENADKVNLFPAKSWYVAPPPPPPAPPPAPTAPPLPFAYMGKQQDANGKVTYFLSQGDRVRLVTMGEILDSTYSVDSIANGQMQLTYIPMQLKQYLSTGETP